MTLAIVQRTRARRDVLEIVAHIAEDSPKAAQRFYDGYDRTLDLLAANPQLGRRHLADHPRLAGVRMVPAHGFRKILIFYQTHPDRLEIVRVLHGMRDLDAAFED